MKKTTLNVIVACETSGTVRKAFEAQGCHVVSVDILPSDDNAKNHVQCDVLEYLDKYQDNFQLMIAHPPCTHLAVSGARWFKDKQQEQQQAIEFFLKITHTKIPRWCIENPIGVMAKHYRKADQIIQPWQHGHEMQKSTCLWLNNLPLLQPSNIVGKGDFHITKSGKKIPAWYNMGETKDRWKKRSKTFEGIALAMAQQWSIP